MAMTLGTAWPDFSEARLGDWAPVQALLDAIAERWAVARSPEGQQCTPPVMWSGRIVSGSNYTDMDRRFRDLLGYGRLHVPTRDLFWAIADALDQLGRCFAILDDDENPDLAMSDWATVRVDSLPFDRIARTSTHETGGGPFPLGSGCDAGFLAAYRDMLSGLARRIASFRCLPAPIHVEGVESYRDTYGSAGTSRIPYGRDHTDQPVEISYFREVTREVEWEADSHSVGQVTSKTIIVRVPYGCWMANPAPLAAEAFLLPCRGWHMDDGERGPMSEEYHIGVNGDASAADRFEERTTGGTDNWTATVTGKVYRAGTWYECFLGAASRSTDANYETTETTTGIERKYWMDGRLFSAESNPAALHRTGYGDALIEDVGHDGFGLYTLGVPVSVGNIEAHCNASVDMPAAASLSPAGLVLDSSLGLQSYSAKMKLLPYLDYNAAFVYNAA